MWPSWGSGDMVNGIGDRDLTFGEGGPGLATDGHAVCNQGSTYAGSPGDTCGGTGQSGESWGQTDLEVWRLAWLNTWDSDAVTNANGKTFTLYLLPLQPANKFSNDAAGAHVYADMCAAAGLRPITTGKSIYYPAQTDCDTYGCMPGGDSGDNVGNNVNIDSAASWVYSVTGWSEFVVLWSNPGTGGFLRRDHAGAIRSDTWDMPLHPVCGAEHCAVPCGANHHCSADGACACDIGLSRMNCDTGWAVMNFGGNVNGQLGDGTADASTPIEMTALSDDNVQVAAGNHHTLVLKADGRIMVFGCNATASSVTVPLRIGIAL